MEIVFLRKILVPLVLFLLISLATYIVYQSIRSSGFEDGAATIQKEWDADRQQHLAEISKIMAEYEVKEQNHREENKRITHELSLANQNHAVALADARHDYERRLQLSSERAVVYQRQAQGGAFECRDLASHASRLDAALEEGRALEREYRATLGLRDRQIEALSNQIRNDRTLMEE